MRTCMDNNFFKLIDIYDRIEDVGYVRERSWTSVSKRHFVQLARIYGL